VAHGGALVRNWLTSKLSTKAKVRTEEERGTADDEALNQEKLRKALGWHWKKTPDRWLDFEMLPDVNVWAYDTPDEVWDYVFGHRLCNEVPNKIQALSQLGELMEELEAASPDDLKAPTNSVYVNVPLEAKRLGLVQDVGKLGRFSTVLEARQAQAKLHVALAQAREGRWKPVRDQLIGAEISAHALSPKLGMRLVITDFEPWNLRVKLAKSARLRNAPSMQLFCSIDELVHVMSRPSVNVSFVSREQEEWREQWSSGVVSVGPAEPSTAFDPGVWFVGANGDVHAELANTRPTPICKVRVRVPQEASGTLTYDRLTRQAEDTLVSIKSCSIDRNRVEPVSLNVERRPHPDGELWVTAIFEVLTDGVV
jgi:hypothetical protein